MKPFPANSRTLSAFAIDIEDELERTGLFSKISIKKTGLSNCALNIICTIENPSALQDEVAQILDRVWKEARIGYNEGQDSHKVSTSTGEVQLQFSTATEEVMVTGRIEVMGFRWGFPSPNFV